METKQYRITRAFFIFLASFSLVVQIIRTAQKILTGEFLFCLLSALIAGGLLYCGVQLETVLRHQWPKVRGLFLAKIALLLCGLVVVVLCGPAKIPNETKPEQMEKLEALAGQRFAYELFGDTVSLISFSILFMATRKLSRALPLDPVPEADT